MATMKEVFNTLTTEQKHLVYVLIGEALKHKQPTKKEYIFMLDEDNNESEANDGRN